MSSEDVVALVLAAGFSRRFGADKRRAKLCDGRGLLQAVLQQAISVYGEVFVVLREEDDPYLLGVPKEVQVIRAVNAGRGLGASLADGVCALSAASVEAGALAVLLGDMPWIAMSTHRRLVEQMSPDRILRPVYNEKSGHPVLFGRDFWPALQCLDGDTGARSVLRMQPQACIDVFLNDPNINKDADTPTDLI
tara:strand:+ start:699 stop:1277 length:579 start_codon:yes stop_codon:yes gene_type:complete